MPPMPRSAVAGCSSLILLSREEAVQHPAAVDMGTRAAEVAEDGLVGAAGLFHRVGQDRRVREAPLVVDHFREFTGYPMVGSEPLPPPLFPLPFTLPGRHRAE